MRRSQRKDRPKPPSCPVREWKPIRALDKKAQGEFSLRLLIAARSQSELQSVAPSVHRVFVEARAQIMEETLGNPFTLEPTESNIQFLYSFIKLLLTNGGAELEPEDDDVVHKAVKDMYLLDPSNRRLSNLYLPKKLDRYLSKWIGKGIYSAIFDNVEDSLSLSRVQCFDFQGVNNAQYADLIEPLMAWLLRRINDVLYNPANLGVPKHILIEELFSSMKNKQLLDAALASIKTVRKNLGGVTMIGDVRNPDQRYDHDEHDDDGHALPQRRLRFRLFRDGSGNILVQFGHGYFTSALRWKSTRCLPMLRYPASTCFGMV